MLLSLLLLLSLFNVCSANILMIISDDMSYYDHIDLPEFSYKFTNAYTQYSSCGPSRSSFLTGRYPNNLNNLNFIHKVNNEITIPSYLKKNGYKTISIGKVFHQPIIEDSYNVYKEHWDQIFDIPDDKCDKNLIYCRDNIENLVDYKLATKAIEYIKTEEKWFMAVGFKRPHLSLVSPTTMETTNVYKIPVNLTKIFDEKNLNYFGYCDGLNNHNTYYNGKLIKTNNLRFNRKFISSMNKEYYNSVLFVFSQVKRIIKSLKNDTIIIFLSDHGWHSGDYRFWCKNSLLRSITKVPLYVNIPGHKRNIITEPVELIDIFPSLLNILKHKPLNNLDGKLFPFLNKKVEKQYAYSQYPRCINNNKLQNHSCMSGFCNLPSLKWMGYSVNDISYTYTGWWPFNEVRQCTFIRYGHTDFYVTKNKYPLINDSSKTLFDEEPIDTLLIKHNLNDFVIIKNQTLENFYKNLIIQKFHKK